MFNDRYSIFFLVLVIICVIGIGKSEFNRGRINMCNEIGWKYLSYGECISVFDYNMRYNNSNKNTIEDFIISDKNLEVMLKNATIL